LPVDHPYRHEARYIAEFNSKKELRLESRFISSEEYHTMGSYDSQYQFDNRSSKSTTANDVK
jgi:hypothetical protein